VAELDHKRDQTSRYFHSSVVYLCTSYGQLVECRSGRLTTVVDLPFNDGRTITELQSVTKSSLLVVESCSNAVAVVDISKRQVKIRCR